MPIILSALLHISQDMIDDKQTILIFVDHYLPGYKARGPIRTLANMEDRLGG